MSKTISFSRLKARGKAACDATALELENDNGDILVLMPLETYQQLLKSSTEQKLDDNEANSEPSRRFVERRSKIDRHPDIAAFIRENVNAISAKDLLAACIERFGKDRAPSKTSLNRYLLSNFGSARKRRTPPV
ncbi:hypothetical protein [Pseudovibrio sp. POLY-S9]|uniref:hypothetical protein n=1 Tax=Pseudovibrio sp. POLY-S9 TaxID=1576596 RepID=UPI00070D3EEF|nr:hypothetical protein [Pseudovibrio sp. POLY-S9]